MKRRSFLLQTSLMLAAFAASSFPQNSFAQPQEKILPPLPEILPYLQNPQPTSMTICFLSTKANDVEVNYSSQKKGSTKTSKAIQTKIPKCEHSIWKAKLTNLKPGSTYTYQLTYTENDKEQKSENYTFTTPNPKSKKTKLIAFNDIHNTDATLEALMSSLKPDDYECSLILGDMWDDPSTKDNAYKVFKTMSDFVRILDASNKPMIFVRGNHETRGGFAPYLSYFFDLPLNNPEDELALQNTYQDLIYGPIWLINPDSGEDGDKRAEIFQAFRDRQVPWLESLLKESPYKKAPWRILISHIPLYTTDWGQPDSLKRWESTLKNAKIDIMLAGHDHRPALVEKGKPIRLHKNDEFIPPYPVLIGGGPKNGTIMLIEASSKDLKVTLKDTEGKELHQFTNKK